MGTRLPPEGELDVLSFTRQPGDPARVQRHGMILSDNGSRVLIGLRIVDETMTIAQAANHWLNFEAVDESDWETVPSSARTDPTVQ
jgi:hypothetical protein